MKGTAKLLMAIAIINMSLILVSPVKATIFYVEHGGTASTEYDPYFEPWRIEAKYTPHVLKLGLWCGLPGEEGIARGSMYVWGKTAYTGWVTGTVKWYMKGTILCSLIQGGGLKANVTVKFRALDTRANAGVEKIIFYQQVTRSYVDYNEEHTGSMVIPLFSGHWYLFFLDVEVHAENYDMLGTDAYADFYGFPGHPSDNRIEWRYMNIPNVSPPGG